MKHLKAALIMCTLVAATFTFYSCSHPSNPVLSPNGLAGKMIGKWTIVTVTTVLYDTTGKPIPGQTNVYTEPSTAYYQFNGDASWAEAIYPDTTGTITGTYVINSDSSFTLINPMAIPPTNMEACSISTITADHFVFSHVGVPNSDQNVLHYTFDMTR